MLTVVAFDGRGAIGIADQPDGVIDIIANLIQRLIQGEVYARSPNIDDATLAAQITSDSHVNRVIQTRARVPTVVHYNQTRQSRDTARTRFRRRR